MPSRNTHRILVFAACALVALLEPGLAAAQTGTCEPASAESYLDVNEVRARIFNGGNLFWRGTPNVYEVPQGDGISSIFTQSFLVAGFVDGEIRATASRYGNYEFWPGPLDDVTGTPPDDCAPYDRIYKVSRADVAAYESSGELSGDLAEWPTGLGAPTLDADGNVIDVMSQPLSQRASRVIDLAAGERPNFTGDQMLWWVMNDAGNEHRETGSEPLHLEVHVTAYAFDLGGPAGETTFYRYRIFYRGAAPLVDAYVGVMQDAQVGNFDDDYVGSDSTLGLAFTYNADNFDEGSSGYGESPPAVGIDFVRGPRVADDTLGITAFIRYFGGSGVNSDPQSLADYYNYMRAIWKDGQPVTRSMDDRGRDPDGARTRFMYDGDPVSRSYWSELNVDGQGTHTNPSNRHYVVGSGPFAMQPGDEQEIVIAVLWARGESHLDSVTELRRASAAMQAFSDSGYAIHATLDAPELAVTAYDGAVMLTWTNAPESSNYLDGYRAFAPALNATYEFEGYNVYRFVSPTDSIGERIAVYDIDNGVKEVIDGPQRGEQRRTAWGADAGIKHHHAATGLTNFRTYCYGIEAYAHQSGYYPRIIKSKLVRKCVEPRSTFEVLGSPALAVGGAPDTLSAVPIRGLAVSSISAVVVDPARVTGLNYEVRFLERACTAEEASAERPLPCVTYEVVRSDGVTVLEATDALAGDDLFGESVFELDGLEWWLDPPAITVANFLTVANAAGPLEPREYAAYAAGGSGFPHPTTSDTPTAGRQQSTSSAVWGFHAGAGFEFEFGDVNEVSTFMYRITSAGTTLPAIGFDDYEMRFTPAGGKAYRRFNDGTVVDVPFELWRIGLTPDDPTDDVRLIPALCEWACTTGALEAYEALGYQDLVYDMASDHGIDDGDNDPYTDWIYWGEPRDLTPGQAGYEAFFGLNGRSGGEWERDTIRRSVLVSVNAGSAPPYPQPLPEEGTVFRIVTSKPFYPGDAYVIDTAPVAPRPRTSDESQAALSDIGIVPNPFYGFSDYQVSAGSPEVRFTSVPRGATIRVFTLSGSLVRVIEVAEEAPSRWDLTNTAGRLLANGLYLIHVDVPDVGSRVVKFALIRASEGG